MSGKLWKQVPDDELVKWLSTSAYLLYKNSKPRIGVFRHQLTRHYKVVMLHDLTFTLANGLVSQAEVNEYFES